MDKMIFFYRFLRKTYRNRIIIFLHCFYLVFGIIAVRAIFIHLFPPASKSLSGIAAKQYEKTFKIAPYRGSIFDRRGHALALSIKKSSLFVNPRVFNPSRKEREIISKNLNIPTSKLEEIKQKKSYFYWLKRTIDKKVADQILKLKIKGVHHISEPARYYPYGSTAASIVGISGIDDNGLMGIEKQYDNQLKGRTSKISRSRDAKGRPIFLDAAIATPETPGQDLYLTIDLALQDIAQKALFRGIKDANAKRGFAIVQDPHTGHILALANYPSFDPNKPKRINPKTTRNLPLVDPFEPGSVLKPILIAEAVEKGLLKMDQEMDCEESGIYREDKWRIRDSHPNGILNVGEVLVKSSNICTYKISQLFGKKGLFDIYKRYGLTSDKQLLGFPGQARGYIPNHKKWSSLRQANISFGQGLMTTALEVTSIYSAFANGGKLLKPIMVDHVKAPNGRITLDHETEIIDQILSPDTTKKVTKALVDVVEKGTASKAKMIDYSSAGKTGTTEKIDPMTKAYSDNLRIASFVGFTPASDPHLVIYVVIDEPQNKPYYGGKWAAPVFREIAYDSLRYLNVPPDKGNNTPGDLSKAIFKQPKSIERNKTEL